MLSYGWNNNNNNNNTNVFISLLKNPVQSDQLPVAKTQEELVKVVDHPYQLLHAGR